MITAAAIILLACALGAWLVDYIRGHEYHPRNYNPPTVARRTDR